MIETREISLTEVLAAIIQKMSYHAEHMEYANSFSRSNYRARLAWSGHKKCYDGLERTKEEILAGNPCNRSVARMFGEGARLQEGFEHLAKRYLEYRNQSAENPPL
jgi:hypothetical protein